MAIDRSIQAKFHLTLSIAGEHDALAAALKDHGSQAFLWLERCGVAIRVSHRGDKSILELEVRRTDPGEWLIFQDNALPLTQIDLNIRPLLRQQQIGKR
ncbi:MULTISPECIES: hypothetical protein, partial [Photorhabdus]|uniref:hypothetical protein n=1 Tax=Photorhabdus TaxID=29487 RepID=UPI00192E9B6E